MVDQIMLYSKSVNELDDILTDVVSLHSSHSTVILIGCFVSGGGALATTVGRGGEYDWGCLAIFDIFSMLLDFTRSLSLCLQQTNRPVAIPPM